LKEIHVVRLGRTTYAWCWNLQRCLLEGRLSGDAHDLLLLTEHESVYTIGTAGGDDHLLAHEEELRGKRIPVYHSDRGGDITYHGPGQLVAYPILDLTRYYCDLHRYLRDLEEVVIRTVASYGLGARREPPLTGVWVGGRKICAIGVKTSRWMTMHGFALNISTDLSHFERIIPCGIRDRGVTSLSRELGRTIGMDEIMDKVVDHFGHVFGCDVPELRPEDHRLFDIEYVK